MSILRLLVPIALILVACDDSGDTDPSTDASANPSVDASTDASTDGSPDPSPDASTDPSPDASTDASPDDDSIVFRALVNNGFTRLPIEGGEFCVLEPEQDTDGCATTNANGMAEWRWLSPSESNFTSRFTLEGYTSMLYLGRWNDTVAAAFAQELATAGLITTNFVAYTTVVMNQWLSTGGITPTSGSGHIFIFPVGPNGEALDGITASLSDGSGTVVYWDANGMTLNAELTASSTTGGMIIANVAPGTYTLNLEHEGLVCSNGWAWLSETPNEYTVPVAADTVTRTGIFCTAQ